MSFGNKTKSLSRLAAVNALYRNDKASIGATLNNDSVLKSLNQAMVVIEGAIRTAFVGTGGSNIQAPNPFPVPKARWFGELAMDTTTKGVNGKGHQVYTYDHEKAFKANAKAFRDRVDDIVKYFKMENDLGNTTAKPNPGGQAGTHGKLPSGI